MPQSEKGSKPAASEVYRWKDAKGTIHFSDRPNPEGPSETTLVDPNVNVLPFPEPAVTEKAVSPSPEEDGGAFSIPLPTSISPDQILELIEDARLLKDLSEGRSRELEQLLGR